MLVAKTTMKSLFQNEAPLYILFTDNERRLRLSYQRTQHVLLPAYSSKLFCLPDKRCMKVTEDDLHSSSLLSLRSHTIAISSCRHHRRWSLDTLDPSVVIKSRTQHIKRLKGNWYVTQSQLHKRELIIVVG